MQTTNIYFKTVLLLCVPSLSWRLATIIAIQILEAAALKRSGPFKQAPKPGYSFSPIRFKMKRVKLVFFVTYFRYALLYKDRIQ